MRGEKPLLAKKPMNYSNYLENKHYINDWKYRSILVEVHSCQFLKN
jgi:hypothetical protein